MKEYQFSYIKYTLPDSVLTTVALNILWFLAARKYFKGSPI